MIFDSLRQRRQTREAARSAYLAAVTQARQAVFYARFAVPDTVDGRFEMIALHNFLILHRLRDAEGTEAFAQALFDEMFDDMDRCLREMQVSDLSIGKHVKGMARSFYGRISSYQAGLAGTEDLAEALRRNLWGTVAEPPEDGVAALGFYLRRQAAALALLEVADLLAGKVDFAPTETVFADFTR